MRIDAHPMRIGRCIRMANPIKIYIPFPLKKNTKYKEQNKKTKKNTLAPPLKNPLAHLWKNEGVAPLQELLYSNPEFAKYWEKLTLT